MTIFQLIFQFSSKTPGVRQVLWTQECRRTFWGWQASTIIRFPARTLQSNWWSCFWTTTSPQGHTSTSLQCDTNMRELRSYLLLPVGIKTHALGCSDQMKELRTDLIRTKGAQKIIVHKKLLSCCDIVHVFNLWCWFVNKCRCFMLLYVKPVAFAVYSFYLSSLLFVADVKQLFSTH